MDELSHLKRQVREKIDTLNSIIDRYSSLDTLRANVSKNWKEQLQLADEALSDSHIRIGIVGSVKSGKSTLINAMLGNDILKRGAGIITSFVTRVISKEDPSGWVELKSIPEVSREVQNLISQFSGLDNGFHIDNFKLNDDLQRETAKNLVKKLRERYWGTSNAFDNSVVLLQAYLNGYEKIKDHLSEDNQKITFNKDSLVNHSRYVADESIATFVRDMELYYPITWLGDSVEIADCQGNDSPNPMHFELLQEYLLKTHFVVYVINSRTGLREADFKLLEFIRSLNMLQNTFFVLNVDIDVHPDLSDLKQLETRVTNELEWIVSRPKLFTFSALAQLISSMNSNARSQELKRYELWKELNSELLQISRQEFTSFCSALSKKMKTQRAGLLLSSGLNRVKMVASSMYDFSTARQQLMDKDLTELKAIAKDIEARKSALAATLQTLENTVNGLRSTLKNEFDRTIQNFFDLTNGPVVRDTINMIDNYEIGSEYRKLLSDPKKVGGALYTFYMDFREAISKFLIEEINVKIINFARSQEQALQERLEQSIRAFWTLFAVAMEDYCKALKKLNIPLRSSEMEVMESWYPAKDIIPPSFSSMASEQVLSKGVLFVKFGIGRISRLLRKVKDWLTRRTINYELFAGEDNLREAVRVVKKETKEEILYAFRDYRQNFKYQYFFRLIDEGVSYIIREFRMRAELATIDLNQLIKSGYTEEQTRKNILNILEDSIPVLTTVMDELENIRRALNVNDSFEEHQRSPEAIPPELVQ